MSKGENKVKKKMNTGHFVVHMSLESLVENEEEDMVRGNPSVLCFIVGGYATLSDFAPKLQFFPH